MGTTNLGRVALNPKGKYKATEEYKYLDVVSYQNATYMFVSKTPSKGITPTNENYWQCMVESDVNAVNDLFGIKSAELTDSANGHISAISLYGATRKSKNLVNTSIENLIRLNTQFTWDGVKFTGLGLTVTPKYTNGILEGFIFNGTATAGASFKFTDYDAHVKAGKYKVIGERVYTSVNKTFDIRIGKNGSSNYVYKTMNNEPFDLSDTDYIYAYIWTGANTTWNNELVKPMLVDVNAYPDISYDDFEPYGLIIPQGKVESTNEDGSNTSSISTKDIIANFDLVEVNGLRNEIHVFADGTGEKIERVHVKDTRYDNFNIVGTNKFVEFIPSANEIGADSTNGDLICNQVDKALVQLANDTLGAWVYNSSDYKGIRVRPILTTNETDLRNHVTSNPVTVVYELATPTVTPLTASEVNAFLELMTYSDYTSIESDAEIDLNYYTNSEIGQALANIDAKYRNLIGE